MPAPIYTFTSDTPQSPNPMNGTQPIILENFRAINEYVNVNHVTFNQSDAGKHNFLSMQNQATDPTTTSTEIAMFTQVTGSPNPSEIFIQYPTGGSTILSSVEISNQTVPVAGTGTSGGNTSEGYCSFPSGIVFRWGNTTVKNTGSTLTYSSGPTYIQYNYCAAGSPTQSGCYISMAILINGYQNNTGFNSYNYASSSTTFNYLMMGM